MKKRSFLLLAVVLTAFIATAQNGTVTPDDTRASLNVSKHIIELIASLSKDFSGVKGQLLKKTPDSTAVYSVKTMDAMGADSQYIMVRPGGTAYYIANYTGNPKRRTTSFAAFTGGVTTLTNADGNFVVAQDREKSSTDKLVYIMSVKGTKVGSYTMEAKKNEGTMIIGFL